MDRLNHPECDRWMIWTSGSWSALLWSLLDTGMFHTQASCADCRSQPPNVDDVQHHIQRTVIRNGIFVRCSGCCLSCFGDLIDMWQPCTARKVSENGRCCWTSIQQDYTGSVPATKCVRELCEQMYSQRSDTCGMTGLFPCRICLTSAGKFPGLQASTMTEV